MLRLLLLFAPVLVARGQFIDLDTCPIRYYGQQYTSVFLTPTVDSELVVCFDGPYNPAAIGDCVFGTNGSPGPSNIDTSGSPVLEDEYQAALPTIRASLLCEVSLTSSQYVVKFASFGTQAALQVEETTAGDYEFDLYVGGQLVDSFTTGADPSLRQYLDISACRDNGSIFRPNATIIPPDSNCQSTVCNEVAEEVTAGCGDLSCLNGICGRYSMCTATGPTVIGFDDTCVTVEDRCTYTMLYVGGLNVSAGFRERARTDVSFVDSLRIESEGDVYELLQDGRVKLNGVRQDITSSPTAIGSSAVFYRDSAGITAVWNSSESRVNVFFDGSTAQILHSGGSSTAATLQGVCVDSSLDLWRTLKDGCQVEHPDPTDLTVDCSEAYRSCNFLSSSVFDPCHDVIDPQPFIKACNETLCRYPDVDAFACQFMEAYDRTCSLNGVTLADWRQRAECDPPEAFCPNRTCTANEYCGVREERGKGCFCRAIFASPFRQNDCYGDPVVHEGDAASVTLIGCLLEEEGFSIRDLHLNDDTCVGQIDEMTNVATFSFSTESPCGSEVVTRNGQVIYKNTIRSAGPPTGNITRTDIVSIEFSLLFDKPDRVMTTLKIRDNSIMKTISAGEWNYTLTTIVYTDGDLTQPLDSNTELSLGQRVWVELSTEGLSGSWVTIVTQNCWATNQDSSLTYSLVSDGCPADATVQLMGNGNGTSNSFSFETFQFIGSSGDIYLNCELELCVIENESCVPVCTMNRRRRRSAKANHLDAEPAFISMVWTQ